MDSVRGTNQYGVAPGAYLDVVAPDGGRLDGQGITQPVPRAGVSSRAGRVAEVVDLAAIAEVGELAVVLEVVVGCEHDWKWGSLTWDSDKQTLLLTHAHVVTKIPARMATLSLHFQ